jgi:hypothetical protein
MQFVQEVAMAGRKRLLRAYHEAGHAVITRKFGLAMTHASALSMVAVVESESALQIETPALWWPQEVRPCIAAGSSASHDMKADSLAAPCVPSRFGSAAATSKEQAATLKHIKCLILFNKCKFGNNLRQPLLTK